MGSVFEVVPEISSLMRFGPPRRNNVTLISFTISVDHRDLDAVDEADCVDAHLAIVVTIVGSFDGGSVKNARRVLKGDPMPADIAAAGAGLILLAILHIPIGRHLKWREDVAQLTPVNASIFHVHNFFICVVLVMMGLPCLFDPMTFLEKSRAEIGRAHV